MPLARRRERLDNIAAICEAAGGTTRVFAADVTDPDAVAAAADTVRAEFGRIDILIANAGINGNDPEARAYVPSEQYVNGPRR